MKIAVPENENYAATIVKIEHTFPLEGLDNLVGVSFFGLTALIPKATPLGEVGVLLPVETQLSMEMAKENNLHRHGIYNRDQGKAGYLEDNRRVRAIRLKGNISNALFLPVDSLGWTGIKLRDLREGDTFDTLNGKEICKKYVKKQKESNAANRQAEKAIQRVDKKFMPEHISTTNYWKNKKQIKGDDYITVTQKLHGTSIRIGNTLVNRKLNPPEKLLKLLRVRIETKEYDNVYGSKNVIKDPKNPFQNHFYSEDIYSRIGKTLDSIVPQGYVIYGEIIGWTEAGRAIQPKYTYNLPVGNCKLYVYRVTHVNPQGIQVDLGWDQLKEFCRNNGLSAVPELWAGKHRNFNVDKFIETKYFENGYKNAVPLSEDSPVDEGVVVRKEGYTPLVLKAKSPSFTVHETAMMDKGETDMEEEQS